MRLTCQVINSQAIPHGKHSTGIQTMKHAFKDVLICAGLIGKNILMAEWIAINNDDG